MFLELLGSLSCSTKTQHLIFLITIGTYLYFHGLWLNNIDFVPVATPDLVMYHCHAPDGVVRPAQVQEVIV